MDIRFLESGIKKLEEALKKHEEFIEGINSKEYNSWEEPPEYIKHLLERQYFTPKELGEFLLNEGFNEEKFSDGSKAYKYHSRLLIVLKPRKHLKKVNIYIFQKKIRLHFSSNS